MNVYANPRYQARKVQENGQSFGRGLREYVLTSVGVETYSRQAFLDVAKAELIEALDSFLSAFTDEVINPTGDAASGRPGIDNKMIDADSIKGHGVLLNAAIRSHHASKAVRIALGFDHGREKAVEVPKAPKGWTKTHGNVSRSIDANGKHRGCWYRIVERESTAIDALDSLPERALNGTFPIGATAPVTDTQSDEINDARAEKQRALGMLHEESQRRIEAESALVQARADLVRSKRQAFETAQDVSNDRAELLAQIDRALWIARFWSIVARKAARKLPAPAPAPARVTARRARKQSV